ncbi:hypothetical protein Ari01nite_21820 [Paractinoplanes rishiriensis]|uniref:YncI copper-binding domain-containing protein n=2 Tax=Paractinoplanes rishiriensis TaxID=1050105 RepID=A0A919N068_9ACTN|nr:hypothetical protein Ari01nite_21820 [Actinoplanes rishiriensis]
MAAVLGALFATPALADVTVSPKTAVQGSGDNLTFTVTNDGTQPLQTVRLTWPKDTPVAEVYPLSVDNWAPRIDIQKLATPLKQIHGATPVTEVAESITWLAMPGKALAPGKSAKLSIAIGPLPTLSSMKFTVYTTYPDGKAGPTMPASIALAPGVAGPNGTGHHPGNAAEDALFADVVADATRGPSIASMGGWVFGGLVLIGALFYFWRGRHRAEEDDEPDEEDRKQSESAEETKEPVAAGKWSLKG